MQRRDMLKGTAIAAAGVALAATTVAAQEGAGTTEAETVKVSRHNSVLLLQIDNAPRNSVSMATLREINAGLDQAASDDTIGAVVITGTGPVFSAGAGGDSMQERQPNAETQSHLAHSVFTRIEGFPKPVIAAVNGVCTNGGNELALSCDIRIASNSAVFGQQELHVGVIPGFGGMQRLQRFVGHGRAMEMIMTARMVSAQEALSLGLVTKVVSDSDIVPSAIELAETLAENLDKYAVAAFKTRMEVSYSEPYSVALRNDQLEFDRISNTEEAKEAIERYIARAQARE